MSSWSQVEQYVPPHLRPRAKHVFEATGERVLLTDDIGSGGFGSIHRGWDYKKQQWVAVKIPSQLERVDTYRRFRLAEIESAKLLSRKVKKGVAKIYHADADSNPPFLVMQLVEGRTLKEVVDERMLATGKGLTEEETFSIAEQLARTLDAAHKAGIVHRDLKPQNIIVSDSGEVTIVDFGNASVKEQQLTAGEHIIGTPSIMSPERFEREEPGTRTVARALAADQYSLGLMIYYCAYGKFPKGHNSGLPLADAITLQIQTGIHTQRPTSRLETLIAKLAHKDPAERLALSKVGSWIKQLRKGKGPYEGRHHEDGENTRREDSAVRWVEELKAGAGEEPIGWGADDAETAAVVGAHRERPRVHVDNELPAEQLTEKSGPNLTR